MDDVNRPLIRAKARLSANGRLVIPAAIRKELGVKPGETVFMDAEHGVLRVESVPTRIARVQREIARFIPPGVSLADELIAERREEARREQEEADRELERDRLRRGGKFA